MSTPYAELPGWADYGAVPLLNLLLAFIVAGLVVLLVGENPLEAAAAPGRRRLRLWRGHRLHALLRHQLHLHRPRRRGRLPCRPVQHRRRGPGLYRRPRRRRSSASPSTHAAVVADAAAGHRSPRRCSARLWALIPAYLQAKRGSHIVITTIMFNFIAAAMMVYLLVNVLNAAGSMTPQTRLSRRRPSAEAHWHARAVRRRHRPGAAQRLASCWRWSAASWSGS